MSTRIQNLALLRLALAAALSCMWLTPLAAADWPRVGGQAPILSMRVQAFFVSDDNGSRKTAITPTQVSAWVDEANDVFSGAGIHLDFDPGAGSADWQEVKSTLINSMSGVDHPQWTNQKAAANALAAATPTKLAAFFRWGPDSGPTGGAFSWTDYNFVAMPGFYNTYVGGVQNIGLFAHEVGHYLGLAHTFGPTFNTVAEAQSYYIGNGRNPALFDGDGRSDTSPDPFISALCCNPAAATTITLDSTSFPLPRSNIMSYYEPRSDVSSSQAWTMRQTLAIRSQQPLTSTVPGESIVRIEGENSRRNVSRGFTSNQAMGSFLGKWSGNSHLLWLDGAIGSELTFNFTAPSAGLYRIYAGFTAAPDFGIHRHVINGQTAADLDLFSRGVLPTGAVNLGLFNLAAGANLWKSIVVGSNSQASPARYGYGLDYILAAPVPEPATAATTITVMAVIHAASRSRRRSNFKPVFRCKVCT